MATITPPDGARPLSDGERALARSVFADAIALNTVELRRRKWVFFQPRDIVMAPRGHLHFHPRSDGWHEDFAGGTVWQRAFLLHELCHVWQHQRGLCLPLRRHPFCRYRYQLVPGRPLARYGIEQQAEIVRHAYLAREGVLPVSAEDAAAYRRLLGELG